MVQHAHIRFNADCVFKQNAVKPYKMSLAERKIVDGEINKLVTKIVYIQQEEYFI